MTDIQYAASVRESNFEHGIDAEGIEGNDEYFLNWKVEQVTGQYA